MRPCSFNVKRDNTIFDREYVKILESKRKLKAPIVLKSDVVSAAKPIQFTAADGRDIIATSKQFGKKVGEHARDFGLDPANPLDREKMKNIIRKIVNSYDRFVKAAGEDKVG